MDKKIGFAAAVREWGDAWYHARALQVNDLQMATPSEVTAINEQLRNWVLLKYPGRTRAAHHIRLAGFDAVLEGEALERAQ